MNADHRAGGHTLEEFLDDFPTVTRQQAVGLLRELSQVVQNIRQPSLS